MHSLFVFNEFSSKKKKQQQSPVFIVLPFYLPFVMFFRSPVCDRTDHSHLEYVFFHSMESISSRVFIDSRHSFGLGVKMASRFRINNNYSPKWR